MIKNEGRGRENEGRGRGMLKLRFDWYIISRPHQRDFLCTKSWGGGGGGVVGGGGIGMGIDRDMKNWEFKTVIIVDD